MTETGLVTKGRKLRLWRHALALSLGLIAAAPTPAQQPAPPKRDDSWKGMQASQAYATARLKASPLRHEWVTIPDGSRTIRASITWPVGTRKAPVVMVVHEVFGLTDSTLNTADEIARMGYITIAPDMVTGLGPNGGDVRSFASSHDTSEVMTTQPDAQVNAAFDAIAAYGLKLPRANGKLALVGLSWGGGAGFRYAADPEHDRALRAVFVFYDVGPPTVTQGPNKAAPGQTPISVAPIDVPVYGFYGSLDTRVMKSLDATKQAMAAAGKPYEPVVYEGAEHAFMRVGEQPDNANQASAAAVKAALARLREKLGAL